jgi:hypothetical protein
VIVDRLETRESEGTVARAARFRWNGGEARVAVEVPAELAGDPDDASPFLPLALLPTMRRGEDLVVDGPVSPRLLRGSTRARELYRAWSPPLHESAIEVAEERECVRRSSEIGCFFSRGVDSTYSAAVPREYPGPLSRLVFVAGLAPEHDAQVGAEEVRRARVAAERIGLPLSVLSVNLLDAVMPAIGNLDDITSPMLALAGLAVGGDLGTVLIPASDSSETLGPFGSSPVLDPLFSTEAVTIENDGVAHGRVAKGLWLARERPDLLAELKVCFHENRPDNCGRCAKCLLTMATLRAAGALRAAHQFPDEVDLAAIRERPIRMFQPRADWAALALAVDDGRDPELHAAILEALAHPNRPFPGFTPREDTPDFRGRHSALIQAVVRDRVPWPPPEPFAAPPGLGLVRAVDASAGRHVYGVGRVPPGQIVGELGSLPRDAALGIDPLWLTAGGYLVTDAAPGDPPRPSAAAALRWALAPLAWRDSGEPAAARLRAASRRIASLVGGRRRRRRSTAPVAVVAHLHREDSPRRLPLYSAFHAVTGDQLLATDRWEAVDMGYGSPVLLGYADGVAPISGTLELKRPPVPWASRFGQRVRQG